VPSGFGKRKFKVGHLGDGYSWCNVVQKWTKKTGM